MNFGPFPLMRIGAGLGVAALLAVLFVNARDVDTAANTRITANLGQIASRNFELNAIVLRLRNGLLNNYDTLASTLEETKQLSRILEHGEDATARRGDAELDRQVAAYSQALAEKETRIESFKSQNSLLRNSLHDLPLSVETASGNPLAPEKLKRELQNMLREVLLLQVAATRGGYDAVSQTIEQLNQGREKYPESVRSDLADVIQHAKNILANQRQLDALVPQITSGRVELLGNELAEAHNQSFARELRRANAYRFFLFLLSLGLLVYAAYAFLQLRRSASNFRQSEARYRSVVASLEEGVVIRDKQGRIIDCNASAERILGRSLEQVRGNAYFDASWQAIREDGSAFPEDERPPQVALRTGQPQSNVVVGLSKPEGPVLWLSTSARPLFREPETRPYGVVTSMVDITARKQAEMRLEFLAHYDALTRLPNRNMFQIRFQNAIARAHRHGTLLGVLFIDLDHFKTINDSLGHATGDLVLRSVAARLTDCVRETDAVARLSGDEFAILLDEVTLLKDVAAVAAKLIDALAQPFLHAGHELFISASIGISCYPEDGSEVETLLRNADAAMYRAKQLGRKSYQFFSAEMNANALEDLQMTNQLHLALERKELLLHYQPRIDLASGTITGVEALIRWQRPEFGLVPPGKFIPLAERIGIIEAIGEWVLETACRQAQVWQASGLPPVRMAVNLSPRQFRQADLKERIVSILSESGLEARWLELEITESIMMQNPEETRKVLAELHALDITISIDDFGTGHSSLSYLKRFPLNYLKVDKTFVDGIPHDSDDVTITSTIIAMAKSLNLRTIAEGVETSAQVHFLKQINCDEIQGYIFSRPRTAQDLEALLRENLLMVPDGRA